MSVAREPEPAARRGRGRGGPADFSTAVQDYLREIYKLQGEDAPVKTSVLARRMGVAAPSATGMVKKLAALGLADHEPYRGVRLTPAGERIALEMIRHHRLLETYLAETLDLGLDEVHDEADRLEHAISEALETRIDEALGSPTQDPHGDPIPDSRLRIVRSKARRLSDLEPGERATVERIPNGDGELLRYLATLGLVPGQQLELVHSAPFAGPIILRVDGRDIAISRELGAAISVEG
jgi:DtxR family transcriptional regulator, Mn-dependent transcriptional regulator